MLVMTACALIAVRGLLASTMLTSIYGLLSASFFVTMDAVDVAFTEAAVGAGVSPLLLLLAIAIVGGEERTLGRTRVFLATVLVFVTGALLIAGTADMPPFGSPEAPVHQHVAPYYLEKSAAEIGIPNVVTSILASYRAYDTLGEVAVIFTAGIAVSLLLGVSGPVPGPAIAPGEDRPEKHTILQIVSKILLPPILLFALYVQFHGEYGPGGGFQAGVIFASGIVLYGLLFGAQAARQVIPPAVVELLAALGVLVFCITGILALLGGRNFLDYGVFSADPVTAQHIGILAVELGVGIAVAAVIINLFYSFSLSLPRRAL